MTTDERTFWRHPLNIYPVLFATIIVLLNLAWELATTGTIAAP